MIKFILIVVVLIVAFPFLAKLIVDYVPKKFHWIISLILIALSVLLAYKIYDGVMGNIKFHQEKKKRYAKVIDRLKIIRESEIAYKKVKGDYTKDFNTLIHFIETDSFPIVRTYEKSKKVIERGVEKEVEFKVVDTIGFTKVIESFKDKDYKDMAKVPGTDVNFDIETGYVVKGTSEIKTPVFEVKVPKREVLKGMDKDLIDQEVNQYAVDQVRGEFISVGTLDDVKDSGNWPPTYDTKEDSDTE